MQESLFIFVGAVLFAVGETDVDIAEVQVPQRVLQRIGVPAHQTDRVITLGEDGDLVSGIDPLEGYAHLAQFIRR